MFRPKNLMSCNFVHEVLLLRNARVSVIPYSERAMSDIEMTVEPELYSTMVLVVSGFTEDCSMFKAASGVSFVELAPGRKRLVREYLEGI